MSLDTIGLSKEDLADAYELLMKNQQEFYSDTPIGRYCREEALRHFKQEHPNCSSIEQLAIYADLENDTDIKNACAMKIEAM